MEYMINGVTVNTESLYTKDFILGYLLENGADDSTLAHIREHYNEVFGNELIWRYPISDGLHAGAFLVCCKEGFLSIPYDCMEKEAYEILEPEKAALHDAESMQYFIDDWQLFSDDLSNAMKEMLAALIVQKH